MRLLLYSSVLCASMSSIFATDANGNMACIGKLQIPAYPPLATQARISGVITVTVSLNSDGTIGHVTSSADAATKKGAIGVLVPAVEAAIRKSTYSSGCAEKPVTMIFHFVLGDAFKQRVSYGYPNRFWIEARAVPFNP